MLVLGFSIAILIVCGSYKKRPTSGKRTALKVIPILDIIFSVFEFFTGIILVMFAFVPNVVGDLYDRMISEMVDEIGSEYAKAGIGVVNFVFSLLAVMGVISLLMTAFGIIAGVYGLKTSGNAMLSAQILPPNTYNTQGYAQPVQQPMQQQPAPQPMQQQSMPQQPAQQPGWFCPNCGKPNQPQELFCPNCGAAKTN